MVGRIGEVDLLGLQYTETNRGEMSSILTSKGGCLADTWIRRYVSLVASIGTDGSQSTLV